MIAVTFSPCKVEHIKLIKPTEAQRPEYAGLITPLAAQIIENSLSFTAWRAGRCLGAGGIIQHWPGRGEAWLMADQAAKPHMRPILRFMRMALDRTPCKRVDITVLTENETGHKFADLLGFVEEARLEAYYPDGRDVIMYKRIK